MQRTIRILAYSFISCLAVSSISAFTPTAFFRPYDVVFKSLDHRFHRWDSGITFEGGGTHKSGDYHGHIVNLLQLYAPTESTIAMLLGSKPGSAAYNLLTDIFGSPAQATLDGKRGEFKLGGQFRQVAVTPWIRVDLPTNKAYGIWSLALFMPFLRQSITNVTKTDQTQTLDGVGVDAADQATKQLITNDIDGFLYKFGDELEIPHDSVQTGPSDLSLMLSWRKKFEQDREYLRNVTVRGEIGLTAPTGFRTHKNLPLRFSAGNNGAWGVPIIANLDLEFVHHLHFGLQVDFLGLFYVTETFRMKTNKAQTDFFTPHKGLATLAQGPTWHFNLFAGWDKIAETGLYGLINYQFAKHDQDRLYPSDSQFDYNIVNSSERLGEWNTHTLMLRIGYQTYHDRKDEKVAADVNFFYKIPLITKKAFEMHLFGGQLALSF
jgi:hypothetical protein